MKNKTLRIKTKLKFRRIVGMKILLLNLSEHKKRETKSFPFTKQKKEVENFTKRKAPSIRTRNLNVDDNSLNIQTNTLDDEDAKWILL